MFSTSVVLWETIRTTLLGLMVEGCPDKAKSSEISRLMKLSSDSVEGFGKESLDIWEPGSKQYFFAAIVV